MRPHIDELESIVRRRVCDACTVRQAETGCGPEDAGRCSLFQLFPLVAQAILATDSGNIEDYIQAIRENVCSVCIDQALDGTCTLRGQLRCALDLYLAEVVDAIEEATGRSFDRRNLAARRAPPGAPLAAEH